LSSYSLAISVLGRPILGSLPSKSCALFLEYSGILLAWLLLDGFSPKNAAFAYLPLVCAVFIAASHRIQMRFTWVLVWLLTAGWWALVSITYPGNLTPVHYIYLAATGLMLIVYSISVFTKPVTTPNKIDLILCSYSGNTAHYAELFAQGAQAEGAEITIHRFHHYREFQPKLNGDSLVVAYPVIGWKPPWPLFNYLLLKLPWGSWKPAFLLYTSAGGPENAGVLVWLILLLKGYCVVGRNTAVYPVNIATVRLGPARLWHYLDSLLPRRMAVENQISAGRDFVLGHRTGLPFILWPTPLFFIGIALDNKIIDIIYRNHVFRKRCNNCGICVQFCPAQRLRMVKGFPRSKGTCALCFGCINICPQNAMHLWLLTEYGNAYRGKSLMGIFRT
jgi:NAD-dependent dihydropyrimidine dehydrogenase PreA subunit